MHTVFEEQRAVRRLRSLDQRAHDWWLARAMPRAQVAASRRTNSRFSAHRLVLAAIWLTALDLIVAFIGFGRVTGGAFAVFFVALAAFLSVVALRRLRLVAVLLAVWSVLELATLWSADRTAGAVIQAGMSAFELLLAVAALAVNRDGEATR